MSLKDDVNINNVKKLFIVIKELKKKNRFFSILEKLTNLNLLEIKKINFFDNFSVQDIVITNDSNSYIKNFIAPLNGDDIGGEKNKVKYEIRFFWPSNFCPELYDLGGRIFNKKYYTFSIETDRYIVTNASCNIKIRENELQIKTCAKTIKNISQFKKKKRINFQ